MRLDIERRTYYRAEDVVEAVSEKLRELEENGVRVDYITFVPDGEPTLDANLGREIDGIKSLGYNVPIAVITNSSLIWREDVRNDLGLADYVSVKVDAVTTSVWRRINRPHPALKLEEILQGIHVFSEEYHGILVSETMMVKGVTSVDEAKRVAEFLATLPRLHRAYIAVPTRPPAEPWATPPPEKVVLEAYREFVERLGEDRVELLIAPENWASIDVGAGLEDVLSTIMVHPLPEQVVEKLLKRHGLGLDAVEELVVRGLVQRVEYRGVTYYVARFQRTSSRGA